ncbi:MAG: transporter substrate-binding domain-containing protein [Oceanospirillaceae bacterium]|nr:transporter substrate-binding domain-containing protein [Oceanospirillaceae bacterium]
MLIALTNTVAFAAAVPISVAIPSSTPPYVIQKNQTGIVLNILKKALKSSGYTAKITVLPKARVLREFKNKRYTAAFGLPKLNFQYPVFFSEPIMKIQYIAISLKSKKLLIDKVSQLTNKRVTAVQSAATFLGSSYKAMTLINPNYDEITSQKKQLSLLIKDRTDIIIMEQRTLLYVVNLLQLDNKVKPKFNIHPIFGPSNSYFTFHNSQVRDAFNQGLKALKKSPEFQKIINFYFDT